MNRIIVSLLLLLSPAASASSPQTKARHPAKRPQKREIKRPARRVGKPALASEPKAVIPPIIGSQIAVVTRDGKRITGQIVDFTALSVQIKSEAGPTTVPLDSVTSLTFAADAPGPDAQSPKTSRHPNFTREVESVLSSLQDMEKAIEGGADYTDYGRQLTGVRRSVEHFTNKYAISEDETEARSAALLAAALTDYTWARTVWTLKLGHSAPTTLSASDSPVVADALDLYPDLRPSAEAGAIPADKLIGGLWKKALANVDRARKLVSQ
jgi:hypothetical protein